VRRPIALALALLLVGIIAAPVHAAAIPQRVFRASFGTSGSGSFTYFTDGSGTMTWALKGLKKSATYKATVYRGKCGNLGTAVTVAGYPVTNGSGALNVTKALSFTKTKAIWEANWYKVLSLKIVSGKSVKCGVLNFVHATRVRIPNVDGFMSAKIDMAVIRGNAGYPLCDVAMYSGAYSQPREPSEWATFVFAHARKGMFLPLLKEWQQNRGSQLIGKYVYVYTSDNKMHTYRIDALATGLKTQMALITSAGLDKLWLQTSTGPNYTYPKLFVKSSWVSTVSVSYAAAHPTPHPYKCG
jgi:hypothetical protein